MSKQEAIQDILKQLDQISPDTDKRELSERLEPVLRLLVQVDAPTAEALLRNDIKARFHLVGEELTGYRKLLRQYREEERASSAEGDRAGFPRYRATTDGLTMQLLSEGKFVTDRLTNFTARIITDVLRDNGVDTRRHFEMEGRTRQRVSRFDVPAARFTSMGWVHEQLGAEAVIFPGFGNRGHARAAIQLLSRDVPRRRVYTHGVAEN